MDIREHLKSLPVGKLKDLARRHNKLYRIKIGQTKDELVESLAKQYEKFTGTNLIPRRVDLVVEPIKLTKKQLPKPAAPAPAPAPRAAPLPVFIKANEALKEKVRKYNEARLAKQKAEKQITEVIKQVEPVIKEVESIPKTQLSKEEKKLKTKLEYEKILANAKLSYKDAEWMARESFYQKYPYRKIDSAYLDEIGILQEKLFNKTRKEANEILREFLKPTTKITEPIRITKKQKAKPIPAPALAQAPAPVPAPARELKTYEELTPEQKKQADAQIKKRNEQKEFYKQVQKEVAMELAQAQAENESESDAKFTASILELAQILGKTPEQLAKEMGLKNWTPPKAAQKQDANVKFSYNEKFVFNPSQEQLKLMAGNQEKFDFYQTPRDVLQQIYNDLFVYSQRYLQFNGTNALEPSAGNGALLSLLIDNQDTLKLKNLDAIEYDENMTKLLKENFKISHIYNDNFFTFKQERPYDLILMNPPYEGLVGTNSENRFNSKVAYLYHIARAILLKSSNGTAKTIYAVVPQLKGVSWPREFPNNKQYEFEDVVMRPDMKRMEKIFGMPFDDFPRALITRIGESDNFEKIVYSRGKFNKRPLGMKVDIYKILVF